MNIAQLLEEQLSERGVHTAVIENINGQEKQTSFRELQTAVLSMSDFLQKEGFKKGQGILLFQPISANLYVYLLACFRLGIVAMFIDPGMGRRYIEQCCQLFQPTGFIGTSKAHLLRITASSIRQIEKKYHDKGWVPGSKAIVFENQGGQDETINASGDDIALLTFTSGSTGKPKAAARSHNFLLAQNRVLAKNLNLTASQLDMTSLPIFVLANLAAGLTSIIPAGNLRRPDSVDAALLVSQLERLKPHRISAPPALVERIISHYEKVQKKLPFSCQVYTGGAPVFPRLMKRFKKSMPHSSLTVVYGSTEAEPIAHICEEDISNEDYALMSSGVGLLAGKLIEDVDLKIIDVDKIEQFSALSTKAFNDFQCDVGKAGECVVTGDHVLKSYLNGIGNEETKFRVDNTLWHRTGDMAFLDASSRLWLLGRLSAVTRDSRGIVYPFSIECASNEIKGVKRSAFLPHNNERFLVLETDDEIDEKGVELLRSKIKIDHVVFTSSLPVDKRHNSKVDYPALRKQLKLR